MTAESGLTVDVLVMGGGVIGASIAHQLARARVGTVALCEQGRIPGDGATTRSAGLLRLHHTSHCQISLAARSLPVFRNWRDAIGGDCGYRPVGFLMAVGPDRVDNLARNCKAVTENGGDTELLRGDELPARWPRLRADGIGAAAYEPAGGYADPAAAASSLADAARRLGVRLWEGVRVAGLRTARGRVTGVDTNLGVVSAQTVVLAGGAWTARLSRSVGIALPVTPRRIGLAVSYLPGGSAGLPACIDDLAGCYFRPGEEGLHFGVPARPAVALGRPVDPMGPDELGPARSAVTTRVPEVATVPITGTRAGFDAYTPDRHAIIGPLGIGGMYVATGFSGGGFKLAPAVGALIAAEISSGSRSVLLDPYRPDRFITGQQVGLDYPYAHS